MKNNKNNNEDKYLWLAINCYIYIKFGMHLSVYSFVHHIWKQKLITKQPGPKFIMDVLRDRDELA